MPSATEPTQEIVHEQGLRHQLSAGQMAMVAVGGSLSTGLLLGSGVAIRIAGPAVIVSFVAAAFISWTAAMALGELACAHPAAGSFGVYGDLYLNAWAGFLARAGYWYGIAISIGAEMVAGAIYMRYWFPGVRSAVWVIVFSAALLIVNLRGVGSYGRFEFWFAMIKVAAVSAFIVLGAALLTNGRVTPQFHAARSFFPNGLLSPLMAMTYAIYSFGGVEMVAVTTGESRSSKETPRAIWLTFITLTLIYLGSIVVLLGVMPWRGAGEGESPFVSVFRMARVPAASHVMNFVVLTAALSGANAALYVGSRMLFSLAREGWAPARFGILNKNGSPQFAVIGSSFGIVLALVTEIWVSSNYAFQYLVGAAYTGMILSWLISLAAHVSFRRRHNQAQLAALPLRSPLGSWGSILGFIMVALATVETWLSPRVNLWSGAGCIIVLTIAFLLLQAKRNRRA